jgi:hypothetical protein
MTHIAIQEALDGENVIWMEPVIDEQYLAGLYRGRETSSWWSKAGGGDRSRTAATPPRGLAPCKFRLETFSFRHSTSSGLQLVKKNIADQTVSDG